ncbi:MAG: ABC transporter permease [Vicinamibacterales bacterium]
MDSMLRDLRHAVRNLLRAPGFAAVAVLTLGLGIGVNTAIFSIVNGVLLRPLPYPRPEQLMFLTSQFPAMGFDQFWVSPPEFFEFRELNQSFASVGAFTTGELNLMAGERPVRVRGAAVTDDLLTTLGVAPAQGRLFAPGETNANGPQLAILSHELWQGALGGRPILGQTVDIDGVRREVIGVMPPKVDVMDNHVEVWLPVGLDPANRQNRGSHFLYLIGRLKDGVTPQAAQAELAALLPQWGERTGAKMHLPDPKNHALQMEPVQAEIVGSASRAIWVLQAAVGFVLLIACANLANLLLARAETRHREFAVRTALGATRGTLLRQFVIEGTVLSLVGGALGVAVAFGGLRALLRLYPESLPRAADVALDPAALVFTLAVCLITGVVFGLAPLAHTRASALATALKEGGGRGATSGGRHGVRRALVVAEVALAVVLVVGAGLMVRTILNLSRVDAGFNRSRLATFSLDLPNANYGDSAGRARFFARLVASLREVPGVQGATAMSGLPPQRDVNANDTDFEHYTSPPEGPFENVDYYQAVAADYFETMGIPIVEGRAFTGTDEVGAPVAIVNETLVKTFFPDRSPLGQRVRVGFSDRLPWMTIVGVVKDVKQGGVDQKTGTELYFYLPQAITESRLFAPLQMHLVVRTDLPPATLFTAVADVVRRADASLPMAGLRSMDEVFGDAIRRPRLVAQLLGLFAGLALLLAAIGTYGVLAYMVTERRREIGIRMALGADQGTVVGEVMRQGLGLAGVGIVVGLVAALALGRLVASLLFGVTATDPVTLVAVMGTLALVAALASGLPAWRASRVDPTIALRSE